MKIYSVYPVRNNKFTDTWVHMTILFSLGSNYMKNTKYNRRHKDSGYPADYILQY